jgi:hypothetical protein
MMTAEEREQYNRLPKADQEEYDHIARKYPNWSHNQIMCKVGFSHKIDNEIKKGENPNPDDVESIMDHIVRVDDVLSRLERGKR